jgi:hypothetical protein
MSAGWYKLGHQSGHYYTYTAQLSKTVYKAIGDGEGIPSPGAIAKALNDNEIYDVVHNFPIPIGYNRVKDEIADNSRSDLPNGIYTYQPPGWATPEGLIPYRVRKDSAITRKVYSLLEEETRTFLEARDFYEKLGSQYRRGVLMYGPPGEGKTTIIRQLARNVFPKDSITIITSILPQSPLLEHLSKYEDSRLKIFVFEELAAVIRSRWNRIEEVLDFLDGESSVDNSMTIATTNYPERLPPNIISRPGRFDVLLEVNSPDEDEIKELVHHFLGGWPEKMKASDLKGLSTAAIKEACLLASMKGIFLGDAVKRIRKYNQKVKNAAGIQADSLVDDIFHD